MDAGDTASAVETPMYEEVYDPSQNKEDWSFSDLDGNSADRLEAESSELHKSIFIKAGAKTVEIYHEKFGTLWAARFVEGGTIPKSIRSRWTNTDDATLAVNLYVAQLESE